MATLVSMSSFSSLVIFFGSLKSDALGKRAAFPLPLVVCVLVFNILNFGIHDLYSITLLSSWRQGASCIVIVTRQERAQGRFGF